MLLLMKKITLFLSALLLSASLVVPAFAASPYDGLAVAKCKKRTAEHEDRAFYRC